MKSQAFRTFKAEMGQANHFLITILIGLDAVEDGAQKREAFNVTWNPQDVHASAARSRHYAIKSALAWAADNLDMYLRLCNRVPKLYNGSESNEISQTKHSVYNRFRCVIKNHTELTVDKYAYVDLLICWRNNTIHFDAENPLLPESLNYFKKTANNDTVAKLYHLDVSKMLIHFKNGDCPTFKEIATLISMTIHFVEELDNILLHDIQQYQFLGNTLLHLITKDNKNTSVFDFANATPEKRKKKIVQFFITHGITEDFYNDDGKEFLDYVSTLTEDEFKAKFKSSSS